jgi:hypothetical protein
MEPFDRKPAHQRIWEWMDRNEDTAFAVIMAGIAALFIIGIVSAFNYAASDVAGDSRATPPAVTAGNAPAQTTGSSGGERPRPPRHDPREDEQMERPQ